MDATELLEFLQGMVPGKLQRRAGCLLWDSDDAYPSEERVEARVAELTQTFRAISSSDPETDARRSYNRDFNRRFIRNELEWRGVTGVKDEQLVFFAEFWAQRLRSHFASSDEAIRVEVIGADGVDDEPLEVAVTFYVD